MSPVPAGGVGHVVMIKLGPAGQVTVDDVAVIEEVIPFACEVFAIYADAKAIGGTTDPTDVDVTVKNGAVDLLAARIPVVNGSTLITAPLAGALTTTLANLQLAAGANLNLDVDVTGGSSPTCDELHATVWAIRT